MNWGIDEFLRLSLCALGVVLGGCGSPRAELQTRLEDPRPLERIRAVTEVGNSGRTDLIAALVDRLDDPDVAVRLYAILGLERLTGTRLGYAYAADSATRREAVERWRHAVATGRFQPPVTLAGSEPAGQPNEASEGAPRKSLGTGSP